MGVSKDCKRCEKPLSPKRAKARKRYCFSCERLVKREQNAAAHDKRICAVYGLNPGEYKKILDAQGGTCAIHGCKARGARIRLAVDHIHALGFTRKSVRGLLCKSHNKWIGWAGDDPAVFDSIAEYLRNPPAQRILK